VPSRLSLKPFAQLALYVQHPMVPTAGTWSFDMVIPLLLDLTISTGKWMIQCILRELISTKARQERRLITYDDIQAQTSVNKNTLTKLANDRVGMVGLLVVYRICAYLDCQPGDLSIF